MMAIPGWAVEALMRSVGSVVEKVPPERIDQLKQRAGQWLDELPQSAARGVDSVMRTARVGKELIDRWSRRHTALVTPVINASGNLVDPRIQGVPIGGDSVELAAEGLTSPPLFTPAALQRLQRRLNRCSGSDDWVIAVANSVDAACLAVGMTRGAKPLFMHRSQSLRLASGTPVPEAFLPRCSPDDQRDHVREVGSVDGVAADDAQGLPGDAMLLAVDHGGNDPLWFGTTADGRATRVVLMTACAGIQQPRHDNHGDLRDRFQPTLRVVDDYLSGETHPAQADLVIAGGDGLLGGPPCGLIIGRKECVEAICQSTIWRSLRASVATAAMMTHALESLASGDPAGHPILSLVHTSEDNLRSRAERLATRISGDDAIRTCQVASESAALVHSGPWRIASRQLRLQHHDKSADSWAQQLASAVPAVLATVQDETLVIDLRWVPPSDDGALAAAILGKTVGDANDAEPQPQAETAGDDSST